MKLFLEFMLCLLAVPTLLCYLALRLQRRIERLIAARVEAELAARLAPSPVPSPIPSPTPVPTPVPEASPTPDHANHAELASHTDSSTFYPRATHEVPNDQVVLTVNWWCLREGNRLRTAIECGHREVTVAQILPRLEQHFGCRGALKLHGNFVDLSASLGELAEQNEVVVSSLARPNTVTLEFDDRWEDMMHAEAVPHEIYQLMQSFSFVVDEPIFGHTFRVHVTDRHDWRACREEAKQIYMPYAERPEGVREAVLELEGMDCAMFAAFGEKLIHKSGGFDACKIEWLPEYVQKARRNCEQAEQLLTGLASTMPDGSTAFLFEAGMIDDMVQQNRYW